MTGQYITDTADASEGEALELTHCPACETPFFGTGPYTAIYGENPDALNRNTRAALIAHHISTHSPADFGVTGDGYKAGDNIGAEPDLRQVVI